jgi:hypothetical protein
MHLGEHERRKSRTGICTLHSDGQCQVASNEIATIHIPTGCELPSLPTLLTIVCLLMLVDIRHDISLLHGHVPCGRVLSCHV